MQQLQQMMNFAGIAAGAQAQGQVDLNIINGRAVTPDVIMFDNGAFDYVSLVGTTLTVVNNGLLAGDCNVYLIYWHSVERSYGNAQTKQLTPAPFIVRAPGSGAVQPAMQVVRRVIVQPADGSDFVVTGFPVMPSDQYSVFPALAGVAAIIDMDCPDTIAGDRTAAQFRVITSAAPANGDVIDFLLLAR